jgi:hypothetical protein
MIRLLRPFASIIDRDVGDTPPACIHAGGDHAGLAGTVRLHPAFDACVHTHSPATRDLCASAFYTIDHLVSLIASGDRSGLAGIRFDSKKHSCVAGTQRTFPKR